MRLKFTSINDFIRYVYPVATNKDKKYSLELNKLSYQIIENTTGRIQFYAIDEIKHLDLKGLDIYYVTISQIRYTLKFEFIWYDHIRYIGFLFEPI